MKVSLVKYRRYGISVTPHASVGYSEGLPRKVPEVRYLSNPARKCGVWNVQSTLLAAQDMPALMIFLACRESVEWCYGATGP
jgi:hypothetical protein